MEKPVRLTIHTTTGEEYVVHSLVAHDTYLVLQAHGKKEAPKHSKSWREANPAQNAAIFDQVCIPYSSIAAAHLTARTTKGDDSEKLTGFHRA